MPPSTALKFRLEIGGIAPDKFRVHEFTMDEALSECFRLDVRAACEEGELAYADLMGKSAVLTVEGPDFSIKHHGMVTEFNQYPDVSGDFGKESHSLDIIIEPHLRLLAYTTQTRIFQKLDAKDIILRVLEEASFKAGSHFRFSAQGPFRAREYTVQYNESDFNFVCRLLEDEGVYYFFDHEGDTDVLVMADKPATMKPIPETPKVDYQSDAGLAHLGADHVMRVRRINKLVTGKVTVKDYNDRTPQVNVTGTAAKQGQGEWYAYGPHVDNTQDAGRMASMRAEMLTCDKVRLEGEGLCRAFRSGYRFELLEPSGGGFFEGEYTLTKVSHRGDQREGFKDDKAVLAYSNTFTGIPADMIFRPALRTPIPKIHGVLTAKVDGVDGAYAYLDDDGMYRAKLPFDRTDVKDGQASLPIRMTQPYTGPNYGMFFPNRIGNEIVLGFVDGDVDRPIGLGTVPNPTTGSPVNKRNPSESLIRTASGHQIRLDDKDGKTAIDMTTKGLHKMSMNDDAESKEIRLKTTDANEIVFDDKNKNIRIATPDGAHLIKLDYDKKVFTAETKYGHKLTMDDESKTIAMQTKEGHILRLDDDKQMLSLQDGKGKHTFQIDAGGGVVSITTEGDMEFTAKGTLNLQAKEINLEAKQGAVNVKAMKDVAVEGMNVNVKGNQKVTLEATLDASVKGMNLKLEGQVNVDSKAGLQNKMTGAMTNVEAQAMNTVKGAIVMIN